MSGLVLCIRVWRNNIMKSSFSITEIKDDRVVILDNNMGGRSVTNDAENVVEYLYSVYGNRRVFYIDSEGILDELRHNKGEFVGFGS
jgi:polysaccharide deacetylase 2 family uncharacterized protein YibQ